MAATKDLGAMLVDGGLSPEPDITGDAEVLAIRENSLKVMREHLATQPTQVVYVDADSRYAQRHVNGYIPVQINGLKTLVKVGERVSVPKQVADLLNASMDAESAAHARERFRSKNQPFIQMTREGEGEEL